MGKTPKQSRNKAPKASAKGVTKPSKSKLKQKSRTARAQIERLNEDTSSITSVHTALSQAGSAPKEVNVLDVKSLKEGLAKDEKDKRANETAENDLTSQLELITGMAL